MKDYLLSSDFRWLLIMLATFAFAAVCNAQDDDECLRAKFVHDTIFICGNPPPPEGVHTQEVSGVWDCGEYHEFSIIYHRVHGVLNPDYDFWISDDTFYVSAHQRHGIHQWGYMINGQDQGGEYNEPDAAFPLHGFTGTIVVRYVIMFGIAPGQNCAIIRIQAHTITGIRDEVIQIDCDECGQWQLYDILGREVDPNTMDIEFMYGR